LNRIGRIIAGIWDFIVGDDWVTAAGVIAALGLTAVISETSRAWWVMPVGVALLLTFSIWREARRQG
jgi:hypothetical protein